MTAAADPSPLAVTGGVVWTAGIVIGALLLALGVVLIVLRRRKMNGLIG